ncbi:unnamed protein product [marine sediment metagenome]|uniref:Uncharacterized protein n=1 Tax=marine sediment metagenome TaxID=412755 RepID=X0WYM9_9ZZZZ
MIYKWKRNPKNAPNAQDAGECIEAIKKRRGGITPQLLVIEANKKRSPLHDCFEWDDSKAAGEYRIVQAREILRFLVIVIEPETETEETRYIRAFIAPPEIEQDDGASYVTIEEVRSDKDLHEAYLRQLKQELDAIKDKIKTYREFVSVVKAIEAVKI